MANDPANIQLGPCRVRWGGIDLGLTKGGVEVEVTTDTKEVMVDQFGNTPVNEYITGRKVSVKCPFAETDIDTLHRLMRNSGATLIDDGVKATGTIVFGAIPTALDTLIVNGVTFTWVASPSALRDVKIGVTQAESVTNLLTVLQACTHASVVVANYTLTSATTITVNYNVNGTAGNAFAMSETGTATTVSATLASGAASTRKRVEVANGIGTSIQASAQELWLRPISALDTDFSQDFVIPLAGTGGGLSFAYKNDDERIFNLTFNGYPNTATRLLFLYGDKRSA
jgi:hypothetical protein